MSQARVVRLAEHTRCQAVTSKGRPCRNRAVEGAVYCRVHAPAATSTARLEEAGGGFDMQAALELLGRRLRGEYEVDIFGFDRELTELLLPAIEPINNRYWRVDVIGTENVPAEGAALLASNHAGTLPLDGLVLRGVVWEHPPHRHARMLAADLVFTIPFLSHIVRKTGNTMACAEDTYRLLEMGELVAVFPEGFKGVGKGWKERYRLQRFGRGGFVEVAIQAQVPIIPVAIVGSEETYPMIADVRPLARLLGLPYFPITMFFPWLGPLGMIPLPSKWIVEFCEPIRTDHLDPDQAKDPMEVFDITDQVRQSIQQTLLKNLRLRRTIFG
jgi:1-acyl-sn-glycerol-3-phosphate acyltransferase